jgi:hypothetical protein
MRYLLITVLLVSFSGCETDARIKRQASLLNVKTQVTAEEYRKADTPAKKLEIADEFFRTAPKMTQVLDDYMSGREPAADPVREAVPVDVTPK